jgi:hypothetical protein
MAQAVEQGKSSSEVENAFNNVTSEIRHARNKAKPTLKERLLTASKVIHDAGNEFAEGVKDGKVMNAHEYQDAYGYVKAAAQLIDEAKPNAPAQKNAVEQARHALKKLDDTWANFAESSQVKTTSSELFGIAAQIELAASALKP